MFKGIKVKRVPRRHVRDCVSDEGGREYVTHESEYCCLRDLSKWSPDCFGLDGRE